MREVAGPQDGPRAVHVGTAHVHFDFSPDRPPAARVPSGARVVLATVDASSGQMRPERVGQTFDSTRVNGVTGPVAVEGARPGQLLAVHVERIRLPEHGHVWVRPGLGFRTGLDQARVRRVKVEMEAGAALVGFGHEVRVPLRPHVGTLGVAPADGSVASKWPGPHGGNMDCTEVQEGSVVWLPVFAPGALFSAGDVHAAMGEGEVGGTGVEVEAELTVRLELAGGPGLAGPVVQTPRGFSLVADGDDLEEAAQAAVERGLKLVGGLWGLDRADAYMLLSMAADLRFGQVALPRVGVWLHLPAQLVGRDPRYWPPGV